MVDFSAIARWPNVPACYEWLSLDRRGDWRLQGERITHRGLVDFMNRQYACDDAGCWFVQNGPQRVFVDLARTPWIYRRTAEGFVTHTGQAAGTLSALYLEDEGSLLLLAEPGIGLLDDRDLATLLAECTDAAGAPASDEQLERLLAGETVDVFWQQRPLQPMTAVDLEKRFNFNARPRP